MRATIKKIFVNTTDKDGNPLKDKNGNPYKKVVIQITDPAYADKYLSQFLGTFKGKQVHSVAEGWKEGDEVSITVEQNGQWLNFKPASKTEERMDALDSRLRAVENYIELLKQAIKEKREKNNYANGETKNN